MVTCFSNSDGSNGINYYRMYGELETLVDYYRWTLAEAKALSVRERRHLYERIKVKVENGK